MNWHRLNEKEVLKQISSRQGGLTSAEVNERLVSFRSPTIVREGVTKFIDASQLVPGDMVLLEAGDAVPPDLRILESVNLRFDEAEA